MANRPKTTLTDKIIIQLVKFIKNNELTENDRLPSIRELSTLWGVTQSQVRSVLIKADALGIVRMESRAGCYVRKFDFSELLNLISVFYAEFFAGQHPRLLNLYDLKTNIEIGIARKVVKIITTEELYEIKHILKKSEQANDRLEKIIFDEEYHHTLAVISHNSLYQTIQSVIHTVLRDIRLEEDYYETDYNNTISDHWKMYYAFKNHDENAAIQTAEIHSDRRKRRILGLDRIEIKD